MSSLLMVHSNYRQCLNVCKQKPQSIFARCRCFIVVPPEITAKSSIDPTSLPASQPHITITFSLYCCLVFLLLETKPTVCIFCLLHNLVVLIRCRPPLLLHSPCKFHHLLEANKLGSQRFSPTPSPANQRRLLANRFCWECEGIEAVVK